MLDRIPQVFLSYSWTSKEYQQNIIELATRMRHDGVDVKLDVWDLKEGQDKYAYMEQCVTNPEIDKVLIFSDRLYTEKANKRSGGVGNETTIISDEVYGIVFYYNLQVTFCHTIRIQRLNGNIKPGIVQKKSLLCILLHQNPFWSLKSQTIGCPCNRNQGLRTC